MSCAQLKAAQVEWAKQQFIRLDDAGYVLERDQNLFRPLSEETARDFGRGSGGELRVKARSRPKLHATHSSAALACNAFDYWRVHGIGLIEHALNLPSQVLELRFEAQFPTGLAGEPPNLDLAFELKNGSTWGVESKFTEPFCSPKDPRKALKDKYFVGNGSLWHARGLEACGQLAQSLRRDPGPYSRLDVAQLLKHILGLHTCRRTYALVYLWLDQATDHGAGHRGEVERLRDAIGAEVTFVPLTYQALLSRLRSLAGPFHDAYFAYMVDRYVGDAAR